MDATEPPPPVCQSAATLIVNGHGSFIGSARDSECAPGERTTKHILFSYISDARLLNGFAINALYGIFLFS